MFVKQQDFFIKDVYFHVDFDHSKLTDRFESPRVTSPEPWGRKNKDIPLKEIPLAVLDEAAFDSVLQYIGFFSKCGK